MYYWNDEIGYIEFMATPTQDDINGLPTGCVEVTKRPSAWHDWDGSSWVENATKKNDVHVAWVRTERDWKLADEVDPLMTNQVRWNSLSAKKQSEWAIYRQALLDVTSQDGSPYNVNWPTKPE